VEDDFTPKTANATRTIDVSGRVYEVAARIIEELLRNAGSADAMIKAKLILSAAGAAGQAEGGRAGASEMHGGKQGAEDEDLFEALSAIDDINENRGRAAAAGMIGDIDSGLVEPAGASEDEDDEDVALDDLLLLDDLSDLEPPASRRGEERRGQ